jgi:hypothetical protein
MNVSGKFSPRPVVTMGAGPRTRRAREPRDRSDAGDRRRDLEVVREEHVATRIRDGGFAKVARGVDAVELRRLEVRVEDGSDLGSRFDVEPK